MNEVGGPYALYIPRLKPGAHLNQWAAEAARKLQELLALGPDERQALVQSGRDWVRRFDGPTAIARYLEIYKRIFAAETVQVDLSGPIKESPLLKLLHILASVNPNGGGPMEGVRQRGMRLKEMGHTVEVVSLDDAAESFVCDFPLKVHALGPAKGSYRYSDRLVPWLMQQCARLRCGSGEWPVAIP